MAVGLAVSSVSPGGTRFTRSRRALAARASSFWPAGTTLVSRSASSPPAVGALSLRVPVPDGSITDLVAVLKTPATVDDINAAFKASADGPLKGILEYSEAPLVSSDIVGNPHSCIYDSGLTHSLGTLVKVLGWYDNEWGYSNRLAELTAIVGAANQR